MYGVGLESVNFYWLNAVWFRDVWHGSFWLDSTAG